MRKTIIIVFFIGLISVPALGGGVNHKLAKKITNCMCNGNNQAFKYGCDFYFLFRLNGNGPEQALENGKKRCDNQFSSTEVAKRSNCKNGVDFVSDREKN